MREKIKYILCAFLTVMLLNMDMQPVTDGLMKGMNYHVIPIIFGYSGYNFLSTLELVLFYFFYRYSFTSYHRQMQTLRGKLCCFLPAVLFGFFMVLGNSFAQTDSWGLLIGCDNPVQLFKSLFAWFAYSVLFVHLIALLFTFIDRYQAGEFALDAKKQAVSAEPSPAAKAAPVVETAPGAETVLAGDVVATETTSAKAVHDVQTEEVQAANNGKRAKKKPKDYDITAPFRRFGRWYMRMLAAHPFRTAFLTLLVAYLPVAIIYYPALVNPDPIDEISQVFGFKYYTANYLQLVDENVVWTNHHPVLYTLYLWLGLHAGQLLFHSYNVGLFLCALGQVFTFAAVIASAVRMLREYHVPKKATVLILLYFVVSPSLLAHVASLTKDILYMCMLLCVCMELLRMLTGREKKGTFVCFLIAVFFATLLRNEGVYVLFASFFLLFLFKKGLRKKFLAAAVLSLGVYLLWNQAILSAFHVTPSSVREVLSVPFQQTARYIVEYGDEVTEEEKEAIDGVLKYDEIADAYIATFADEVKSLYREDSDGDALKAYFRVWLQMFCKHPGVYVEATLSNIIHYFFPSSITHDNYSRSVILYENYDMFALQENGLDFTLGHPDALLYVGLKLDGLLTTLNWLPGVELLQSSALYVWLFLLLVFYACKTKKWRWVGCILPVGFAIGVCLLSPVDGWYFRYILPTACTLPPIAALLVFGRPEKQPEGGLHGLPDTDSLHELPEGDAVLEAAAPAEADSLASCQNG